MNRLLASGGQSTGASASASVFPMNIQGWFPLELPGPGDSPESSSEPQFESTILWHSAFFMVQLSHQYMTTEKTIALTIWTFAGKVMSLLFNTLSRFSHGFSSKEQVSFNFTVAVTTSSDFGAQENKICHFFHFSPFCLPWSDGTGCYDLDFF